MFSVSFVRVSLLVLALCSQALWAEAVTESMTTDAMKERLKPIGDVSVEGGGAVTAKPAVLSVGQQTFQTYCHACHGTGVAGAPKYGDKTDWAPRIKQGHDVLVAHAIKGIRAMPPKGTCMDCSDDDISKTVDYMLKAVK